jgi:hypothetical protein
LSVIVGVGVVAGNPPAGKGYRGVIYISWPGGY